MLSEEKLANIIHETIDEFTKDVNVTLAAAIGCLELVKRDLIDSQITMIQKRNMVDECSGTGNQTEEAAD